MNGMTDYYLLSCQKVYDSLARYHRTVSEVPYVTAQTPIINLGRRQYASGRAARLAKNIAPGVDLYLKYRGYE